jgi:hypothetical protein
MAGKHLPLAAALTALTLSACGGGAGGANPLTPQVGHASGAVTFHYTPGFVCCPAPQYTIVVQSGGSATKSVGGVATATVQLPPALTTQIFSDVQAAWPLNNLPAHPGIPDTGALSVSADGQTSPDIRGGTSGIEAALNTDAANLNLAFGP